MFINLQSNEFEYEKHLIYWRYIGKISNFAGFVTGIEGFALIFVYVIEYGLIFIDIANGNKIKIDSAWVFLEWDKTKKKYKCIYIL